MTSYEKIWFLEQWIYTSTDIFDDIESSSFVNDKQQKFAVAFL